MGSGGWSPGGAAEGDVCSEQWYALRVRSRSESVTYQHLQARGYKAFLPLYRSERRWSDRLKRLDLPLFPGYVFCRFLITDRFGVVSAPGVVSVLGAGPVPHPIDPSEIAAIETIAKSGYPARPWPFLQTGQIVRIEHGALQGLEGLLLEVSRKSRLVVSVTLLQRSVAVEIDRDWITPVRPAASAAAGRTG
jgi:transcription antitermination factor NusG